eukprot:XP_001694328.1 predicted protein [Chlamydomonas reinhardtii]
MAADELVKRVSELSVALVDRERELAACNASRTFLQQDLEATKSEISAAREELSNETTKCSLLESRLQRVTGELEQARADLASSVAERDSLHRTLGRVHEQLTVLKSDSSGKSLELAELQLYYDGLLEAKEASIQSLQTLLEGQQKQLREQQELWDEQRRSLKASLNDVSERVAASQAAAADAAAMQQAAAMAKELRERLLGAERALEEAGAREQQYLAVAEERRKREKLKSRLVSVGREAEELRLQVSRLQAELAGARADSSSGANVQLADELLRAHRTIQEAVSTSLDVATNPAVAYMQNADFLSRLMREWAVGDKAALDAAIEASVSAAVALVNEAGARLQTHARDLGVAQQQLAEAQDAVAQLRLTNGLLQQEADTRLAEVRGESEALRSQLDSARDQVARLQVDAGAHQGELAAARERAEAAAAAAKRAESTVASVEGDRARLRKVLASVEGDRGSAEAAALAREDELLAALKGKIRDVVTALESPSLPQLHAMMLLATEQEAGQPGGGGGAGAGLGSVGQLLSGRGGGGLTPRRHGGLGGGGGGGQRGVLFEDTLHSLALGLALAAVRRDLAELRGSCRGTLADAASQAADSLQQAQHMSAQVDRDRGEASELLLELQRDLGRALRAGLERLRGELWQLAAERDAARAGWEAATGHACLLARAVAEALPLPEALVAALLAQAARFLAESEAALEAVRREAGQAASAVMESVMEGVREEVAAVQSHVSELQDSSTEALRQANAAWSAQLNQVKASSSAAVAALEDTVSVLQAQLGSEADAYDALKAEQEAAAKESTDRAAAEGNKARGLASDLYVPSAP